jgi:hypothetical protein
MLESLAQAGGFSVRALQGRSEQRRLVAIRDQLVYTNRQYFFYPTVKVAHFLGRTASAITYSGPRACRQLTERPQLEQQLEHILLKAWLRRKIRFFKCGILFRILAGFGRSGSASSTALYKRAVAFGVPG